MGAVLKRKLASVEGLAGSKSGAEAHEDNQGTREALHVSGSKQTAGQPNHNGQALR